MDQFMVSVQMFFQNLGQRLYDSFIYKDRYMYLVQGLGNTLLITLGAVLIGVVLGTLVSLVRIVHSQNPKKLRFLNAISGLYLTVFRGTPMVVQLIIMYYIVFGAYRGDPLLVAIIAFGINLSLEEVYKIIDTFIATKNPSEDRHLRRITKVEQIENGEYHGL